MYRDVSVLVKPLIHEFFLHLGDGIQERHTHVGLKVEIVVRRRVWLNFLHLVDGALGVLDLSTVDLKELRERQVDDVQPIGVVVRSIRTSLLTCTLLLGFGSTSAAEL